MGRWCSRQFATATSVVLAAALLQCAASSLMGVDLGLSYIKVSVARPGKGLELVSNEQAKRKTPAAVGFTEEGERLFGDAAIAYSGKAPKRVVLDGRNLIGKCAAESDADSLRCPRKVVTVDGAGDFNGEHIVAMLLAMARRQASASLDGAMVKDVVVSVPAWFDHRDRVAVVDAARVIGLNCLAVVNANTAAAVKYALDGKGKVDDETAKKKGSGKAARTQTVLVYDLGAGSATASIAQIVTDSKTGAASSVKMLGHEWELDVGGRAFDQVVLDKMADDFDAQRGAGATPARELPRVMMRLRKEAQRVREILSANTETIATVPSLHDDVDFRAVVKRADFEKGAENEFQRAVAPAKRVLASAGLSVDDVDAVVPFGGASRTPRVQELLCQELGISSLNKSINSDEAAVFGNAFFAASMSSTFRVRKMDIEDVYGRAVSAEVERDAMSGGMFSSGKAKPEAQKVVVFNGQGAMVPAKKTLSFKREDDFAIDIYVDKSDAVGSRYTDRTLYSRAKVTGVAKVLKKLKNAKKANGLVPQISLTVLMDRSGFIRFGTAESAVDEVVEVEREVPIEDKKKSKSRDKSKDGTDSGDDKLSSPEGEDDVSRDENGDRSEGGDSKENSPVSEKPKTRIEKTKQTLVHRQPLSVKFEVLPQTLQDLQMDKDELAASRKLLSDLEAVDNDRQERADALNSLEGFVLEVRSTIRLAEDGEPLFEVTTSDEREALADALDAAEDWMYTEEAKATKSLTSKLTSLRSKYDAMKLRAEESAARPEAVQTLRELLESAAEKVTTLRAMHANGGTKSLATFDELATLIKDTETWLAASLASQEKLASHETPAFMCSELSSKSKSIERKLLVATKLKLPEVAAPGPVLSADDASSNETASAEPSDSSKATEDPTVVDVDPSAADMTADSPTGGHDEL
jgi:hypoxia up-regulated 1